jgi:uncharacterized protein involved in outer membrane biogenesis
MKKILIRVLIVVVILLVLAVIGVAMFLDSGIKKGIETFGPQLTKVDVKLDSVSLSLLSGSGKIKGLVVGNPQGFKEPHAIKLGSASLSVVVGSVFKDKVVIKSIRVEAPDINYETGLLGGDNLHKILDNVNASVAELTGGSATNAAATKSTKPAKKLQVDDFLITGAKVHVSVKGTGIAAPVPIPEIHFTNLGQGPDGITPAELTKKVVSELTESVVKNTASVVKDAGKAVVEGATKEATKTVKGIGDLFKKK